MTTPAIHGVIDALVAAVEAIDAAVHADVKFARTQNGEDPRGQQQDVCERQFRLKFLGLTNASDAGNGVITEGIDDREVTFALEVAYPMLDQDGDSLDLELASDAELVHRALSRRSWPGTVIQRAAVSTTRNEDLEDAQLVIVSHALTVQYRDTH